MGMQSFNATLRGGIAFLGKKTNEKPRFLPWMQTNHQAIRDGKPETRLLIHGQVFQQKTFKHQSLVLNDQLVAEHSNSIKPFKLIVTLIKACNTGIKQSMERKDSLDT
jgi:hypothetical protein